MRSSTSVNMKVRLLSYEIWLRMAVWAALLHALGAVAIDFILWKSGFVYQVMAGQLLLMAGGVWLLIVLVVILLQMRRLGYLDPLRIILWVLGVSLLSAPLKAIGEKLIEPFLQAEYEAYPEKRAAALRAYFRAQSESGRIDIPPEQRQAVIEMQTRLYAEYRKRQRHLGYAIIDRMKVLGVFGLLYGLILGLLLRGGGTFVPPQPAPLEGSEGNAGSS